MTAISTQKESGRTGLRRSAVISPSRKLRRLRANPHTDMPCGIAEQAGILLRATLVTAVLLVVVAGASALAAEKLTKGPEQVLKSGEPIEISSDRMEVDQASRTIVFEGHVVVQQGDVTLSGKKLTVYGAKEGKLAKEQMVDQIDRIEVTGDVKVSQQDKVATAGKAVFYSREQKIVLSDNPRITQGNDHVEGALITLYLKDERSVIEGSQQQPVQALLHPKNSPKKGK